MILEALKGYPLYTLIYGTHRVINILMALISCGLAKGIQAQCVTTYDNRQQTAFKVSDNNVKS